MYDSSAVVQEVPFRFRQPLIFQISAAAALSSDLWFAVSRSAVDGSSYIKMNLAEIWSGGGIYPSAMRHKPELPSAEDEENVQPLKGRAAGCPLALPEVWWSSKGPFSAPSVLHLCGEPKCQMQLLISLRAIKFRLAKVVCVRRKARQKCLFQLFSVVVYLESLGCQTHCSSSSSLKMHLHQQHACSSCFTAQARLYFCKRLNSIAWNCWIFH